MEGQVPLSQGKGKYDVTLYFYFENEPKVFLRSINKIFLRYIIKILHKEDYLNCHTSSPNCAAPWEPQQ